MTSACQLGALLKHRHCQRDNVAPVLILLGAPMRKGRLARLHKFGGPCFKTNRARFHAGPCSQITCRAMQCSQSLIPCSLSLLVLETHLLRKIAKAEVGQYITTTTTTDTTETDTFAAAAAYLEGALSIQRCHAAGASGHDGLLVPRVLDVPCCKHTCRKRNQNQDQTLVDEWTGEVRLCVAVAMV